MDESGEHSNSLHEDDDVYITIHHHERCNSMVYIFNEFFVLNESGITLFSYASDPEDKDIELISGFLTALNMFAKTEKGESMKSLTLEQTNFIFERRDKLIYVLNSEMDDAKRLLHHFLDDLIDKFQQRFSDEITAFDGNIAVFEEFTDILHKCMKKFALNILQKRMKDMEENEFSQSISVIMKETGELLFSKAKQYVDSEQLAFLVPLLVKGARLAVKNLVDQDLEWILVITSKRRVLMVQPMASVFVIEEFKVDYEFPEQFNKKAKKLVSAFHDDDFLPEIRYIKVFRDNGKVIDEYGRALGYETTMTVDATMVVNAGRNFTRKYYKVNLAGIAMGDSDKSTLIVPFKDFFAMVRGDQVHFKRFSTILQYIESMTG
ncbi:hypothetical protein GF325_14910 [Candidatus Bathyarchaeota archaeon]|nr:hypothetical protein [Candidatus Bathyarchaeota archaeon]